jgi:hypothetical protein
VFYCTRKEVPCPYDCRVELRTQEGEKGLNSEEAERLVWAAQTIFATSCEPPRLSPACTYNYRYYLC